MLDSSELKEIFLTVKETFEKDDGYYPASNFDDLMNNLQNNILPIAHLVPDSDSTEFLTNIIIEFGLVHGMFDRPNIDHHDNPKELWRKFGSIGSGLQSLSPHAKTTLQTNIMWELLERDDLMLIRNNERELFGTGEIIFEILINALSREVNHVDQTPKVVRGTCSKHLKNLNLTPDTSINSDCFKLVSALLKFWKIDNTLYLE